MLNNYLFLGAAAGGIAMCWNYVKWFWVQISSLLIVRASLEDQACNVIRYFLQKNGQEASLGSLSFTGCYEMISSLRRNQVVIFREVPFGGRIYLLRGIPIWLTRDDPRTQTNNNAMGQFMSITFLRWTINVDQLIKEATDTFNNDCDTMTHSSAGSHICHLFGTADKVVQNNQAQGSSRDVVSRPDASGISLTRMPLTHKLDDLGARTTHGIRLIEMSEDEEMRSFVEEFERWYASKSWYESRNINWRRGWLFTGPPGTGKTSITRALAQKHSLPVFSLHIETMYNDELFESWSRAIRSSPCIVLIEDIDATFEGRKTLRGKLTFDALLNCIDGIESADGVALIITTNFPESLDIALASKGKVSRPGRIDRVVRFGPLTEDGRLKMVRRILPEHPEVHSQLVAEHAGKTAAQFQDVCTRLALTKYWESNHADLCDLPPADLDDSDWRMLEPADGCTAESGTAGTVADPRSHA